jgi:hypothetical protein
MADRYELDRGNPVTCPDFIQPQLTLAKWDARSPEHQLPESFFCILLGSRRIGKSIFAKYLLYQYRDRFDLALVMTQTPQNGFWQPIVGNQWVHRGMQPDVLAKMYKSQEAEKAKSVRDPKYKPRRVLLIFDDIVSDRNIIHNDIWLNTFAVQGRHFYITVLLTTQYPSAINTYLRENTDLAVVFQQKTRRAQEHVYEDFLSKLGDKRYVEHEIKKYTTDHDCVVVEAYKLKQRGEDIIYWSPASVTFDKEKDKERTPDYQIGCDQQKLLARTPEGKLPLFSEAQDENKTATSSSLW